jgi:hypothetical protein
VGDKPPGRFAASEVTYSLPVRLLLTLPALLPVWLLGRLVVPLAMSDYNGEPFADVPLAAVGALLLPFAAWHLRDLWRVNPHRKRYARDADRTAAGIAERFAKPDVGIEPPRYDRW